MPASGIFRFHFLPGQIRAPLGWLCLDIVFVDALLVRPPSKPFWPCRDLIGLPEPRNPQTCRMIFV